MLEPIFRKNRVGVIFYRLAKPKDLGAGKVDNQPVKDFLGRVKDGNEKLPRGDAVGPEGGAAAAGAGEVRGGASGGWT